MRNNKLVQSAENAATLRCGDCPKFRNGWCAVRAAQTPRFAPRCNYGASLTSDAETRK